MIGTKKSSIGGWVTPSFPQRHGKGIDFGL
jgi:hypothetical protein